MITLATSTACTARRGDDAALRDIELTVDQGEFVAVMGPFRLRQIDPAQHPGLIDRPTSGRHIFLDNEVGDMSEAERAKSARQPAASSARAST